MGTGNTKKPTMSIAIAKGFGIFRGFSTCVNTNL